GQPMARGSPQPPGPSPGASTAYSGIPSPSRSPRLTSQAEGGSEPLFARPAAPSAKKDATGPPPRFEKMIAGRPFAEPLVIGLDWPGGQAARAAASGRRARAQAETTKRPARTRRSGRADMRTSFRRRPGRRAGRSRRAALAFATKATAWRAGWGAETRLWRVG